MKKILLSLLFSPVFSFAGNIQYPRSSIASSPVLTTQGSARASTTAQNLALSHLLNYGSSGMVGAYVPIKYSFKGVMLEMYYRISGYTGPNTNASWGCVTYQSQCGATEQCGSNGFTINGSASYSGNVPSNNSCYGYWRPLSANPGHVIQVGKLYSYRNYEFCNFSCSPPLTGGTPSYQNEFWGGLFATYSIAVEQAGIPLSIGSVMFTSGTDDITAAILGSNGVAGTQPTSDSIKTYWTGGDSQPPVGQDEANDFNNYISGGVSGGGLTMDDTDISTCTSFGNGSDTDTGAVIVSSANGGTTIIFSTGEIVGKLEQIRVLVSTATGGIRDDLHEIRDLLKTTTSNDIGFSTAPYWSSWTDFQSRFSGSLDPLLNILNIIPPETRWVPCFDMSGMWSGLWAGSLRQGQTGIYCLNNFNGWNNFIQILKCFLILSVVLYGFWTSWALIRDIRLPGVTGALDIGVGIVLGLGAVAFSFFVYEFLTVAVLGLAGQIASCIGACQGLNLNSGSFILMADYLGVIPAFSLYVTIIQAQWNFLLFMNFWGALKK